MKQLKIPILLLMLFSIIGCEEELDHTDIFSGFWVQESILENDNALVMSQCETSARLLVEPNGVYRLHSSCDTMERSGTWIISNDSILDLSMDRWNGSNSYEPYPVRFTMTKLTDEEMELRIKTFIGDRKKLVMFTPVQQDSISNLTDEEILELDRFNKTLKTYIYRFTKQD